MGRGAVDRGDTVVVSTVTDENGFSPKSYPLAQIPNNYSYEDVSDQPEAQPNQPVSCPLSFHGGMSYSHYDPSTAGYVENLGWITNEPNVLRPPLKINTVTLTGAANPVQYAFETTVNDSGADDGSPVAYFIAPEAAEINVYKVSLTTGGDYGTANAAVTTTDTTLTDTREGWTVNEWAGDVVTCNSKALTVTSNTATVLTGASWSAGGNPGDGAAWIMRLGGYSHLLNTKTFATTPTQPMGHPAEWNNGTDTRWYIPQGDNGYIQELETIASATADDTYDDGTSHADARHLKVAGTYLYRTTAANEVSRLPRGSDPLEEANWGDEFYAEGVTFSELGEAGGLNYIASDKGFHEWDGIGDPINILPEIGQKSRNGQGMVYWHGGFLIPTATGLWWTRTGKPVGPDSNPDSRGNHPSIGSGRYFKQGRWMGLAPFGEYIYGLYVNSLQTEAYVVWGRERDPSDPPGWGPIIWHTIDVPAADLADFHGIFALETSALNLGTAAVYPALWFADGNDVSVIILDHDGSPRQRRGSIELEDSGSAKHITSGDLNCGPPGIQEQLRVIEGWAEDVKSGHSFQFQVGIDGGAFANVGAAITEDGFFQRFWVQDTSDTGRSMQVRVLWTGTANLTKADGPHLRDKVVRAVALPKTTRVWTFLLTARDAAGKTGKLVRSELEAYKNDLKKYELPDSDSFNGVLTKLELLRGDQVRDLLPANQPAPHYVMRASVREMVAS